MKKFSIKLIVALGVVSISVLILVQFFWAKNIVELEQKQFDHKVKIALSEAGYKLRLIQHASISSIHPVKKISDNQFVVEIQDIIKPVAIDSILQQEFTQLDLDLPYSIAIYDCFTDSVVFAIGGSKMASTVPAEEYGVDWNINSYNFGVVFSEETRFQDGLTVWTISVTVVFMVALLLAYVIYLLNQQKKLDEVKNDFINNMTHELKTPISTIALSAEVLCNEESGPEKIKRYAGIVKEENLRLKNQVERVLQTAFIENDKIELNKEKIELSELIDKAFSPYSLQLEQRNGSISLNIPDGSITVDVHHMSHVLSNLFDNAIKYSDDRPEISVEVNKLNDNLSISIRDNGIGISKENLQNVFKKFYRVPTGDVHNVKGFGIGLNYAQLIVQLHEGSIEVKSELNNGTTFVINLPNN